MPQRNDSCVIDSQVPTCSKYTTGWNFDSPSDLLLDTVSESTPHQTSDSKEELVSDILLKKPSTNIMDSQNKHLDPDDHVRKDYDQHNKVFPELQESSDTSRNMINTIMSHNIQHMVTSNEHQANKYYYCDRVLKSIGV